MAFRTALLALLAALASGQSQATLSQTTQSQTTQPQTILELARKTSPEFFADTVVKLVRQGRISDPDQRQSLLMEAFEAAKPAREPMRLVMMPGLPPESRAGMRDAAGMLGLDAYSLELRVVTLLAVSDPAKARDLFLSLDHPALDPRPCEDPMIANPAAYYEMAGAVASQDLFPVLGGASSPSELASFSILVGKSASIEPQQFRVLVGLLALKMPMIAPDFRSFTLTAEDLRQGLENIAKRARELDVPLQPLAEGVRKMTGIQLSSSRCDEEFGGSVAFVEWFNRNFRGSLDALSREETRSLDYGRGSVKPENYFAAGTAKEIADKFQELRTTLGNPEWSAGLASFLASLSGWKPSGGDIDEFHQRMTVLHGLYQLVPPADRDTIAAQAIILLESNGIESKYPAEWLLQVRSFVSAATDGRAKLLEAFRASADPGLQLFAELN